MQPRWRLCNHPFHRLAYSRLNPSASPLVDAHLVVSNVANIVSVQEDLLAELPVPPDHLVYHHLNQAAKQLVTIGQRSPAEYKRVMMGINALISQGVIYEETPLSGPLLGLRAPLTKNVVKRGRPANADLENRSALRRDQVRSTGTRANKRQCSLCKQNGVGSSDHHLGTKCPFYKSMEC